MYFKKKENKFVENLETSFGNVTKSTPLTNGKRTLVI